MLSQIEKARAFFALHRSGAFIMPNAWDAGSAKILAAHGFKALGTTSSGFAFGLGRPDALSAVSVDEALGNIAEITAAVDIPVSADFENGYADDPADVAENVRRCIEAGAADCSIEDWTGDTERGFYDEDLAVERVAAAVEAAGEALVITARCEALLYRHPDGIDMVLRRLKRFAAVGAACVYAPGVVDRAQIMMLVREAGAPVNQLVGLRGVDATVEQMAELGVRRLSVGGSLMRATIGPLISAAQEMRDDGTFTFVDKTPSGDQILEMFEVGR